MISRKGGVVDRNEFEKMMKEYYGLRGLDRESGLQKEDNLIKLGLSEIVPEMKGGKLF